MSIGRNSYESSVIKGIKKRQGLKFQSNICGRYIPTLEDPIDLIINSFYVDCHNITAKDLLNKLLVKEFVEKKVFLIQMEDKNLSLLDLESNQIGWSLVTLKEKIQDIKLKTMKTTFTMKFFFKISRST